MLNVDLSTLEMGSRGSVTGRIWFNGESPFPERDWSDFPIEVVTWWLELLVRLARGQARHGEISFMDGPFRVSAVIAGDALYVELTSEHPARKSESRTGTFVTTLQDAIITATALVQECRRRGWISSEIDNLQRALMSAQSQTAGPLQAIDGGAAPDVDSLKD